MIRTILFLVFINPIILFAQVDGKVVDVDGNPMKYVSIVVENTYIGTSTNLEGEYQLKINKPGEYSLIIKRLGYKTIKESFLIEKFPFRKDFILEEDNLEIEEVVINNSENPANRIIRKAIANREKNSTKTDKYYADFYSRGSVKVSDLPKLIKKQKDPELVALSDTANSGFIYLSETISKVTFQKPHDLKEHIIASKVSGNDRGYSYNTAMSSYIDFYDSYVNFGTKMISPISNIAFTYYIYRLENSFESDDKTIYKIKVIAKRDKEPVVEGYIYIVDDTYEIYAVEFDMKGYRLNKPLVNNIHLTQHYVFNSTDNKWVKKTQFLDLKAGFLGFEFIGSFTSNYSNYQFVKEFEKGTFGRTVVNIEKEANEKDDKFWETNRPIPLLPTEIKDYFKKDSIQTVRNSPKSIDSIDRAVNKFQLSKIIGGYTYQSTPKDFYINYSGLFNLRSLSFNPVQGWVIGLDLKANKGDNKYGLTAFESTIRYGFAEEKLRMNGSISHQIKSSKIELSGGNPVLQFNGNNPIHPFLNMLYSLFYRENYIKLYESRYAKIKYSQSLWDWISFESSLSYQNRNSLFNTTSYSFVNNRKTIHLIIL